MVPTVRNGAGCALSPELLASGWVCELGRVQAMAKHDGTAHDAALSVGARRLPDDGGERPAEHPGGSNPVSKQMSVTGRSVAGAGTSPARLGAAAGTGAASHRTRPERPMKRASDTRAMDASAGCPAAPHRPDPWRRRRAASAGWCPPLPGSSILNRTTSTMPTSISTNVCRSRRTAPEDLVVIFVVKEPRDRHARTVCLSIASSPTRSRWLATAPNTSTAARLRAQPHLLHQLGVLPFQDHLHAQVGWRHGAHRRR